MSLTHHKMNRSGHRLRQLVSPQFRGSAGDIESDPNAEQFYRAMGALRTGTVESGAIPGRELPLMELNMGSGPSG